MAEFWSFPLPFLSKMAIQNLMTQPYLDNIIYSTF